MTVALDLLPGQHDFLADDQTRNLALIGGMGSGKTRAGALKAIDLALKNPGHLGLIASTDASTAKDTIVLATQEVLEQIGIPFEYNKALMRFELKPKGQKPSTIKTVTYGQPLIGFNAAFFVADEIDTLQTAKAREAWGALSMRVRVGRINQMCATTTPEGFRFCYEFFENEILQDPSKSKTRKLIRASTLDNPWLPDHYIENIFETRTKEQALAYVYGQFVNFAAGTVYKYYDRKTNNTKFTAADFPDRPLWVGIDFNVDQMAGVVAVIDQGCVHIVDELISFKSAPTIRDTRELILLLKAKYPNRQIIACPDAAGEQRNTAAWGTNIEQLRMAGYTLRVNGNNPRIEDRVNSVNALFQTEKGTRRLFVNSDTCPNLVKCLEQQAYAADGKPDKKSGLDHGTDALGYLIWQSFPLRSRIEMQARLVA